MKEKLNALSVNKKVISQEIAPTKANKVNMANKWAEDSTNQEHRVQEDQKMCIRDSNILQVADCFLIGYLVLLSII